MSEQRERFNRMSRDGDARRGSASAGRLRERPPSRHSHSGSVSSQRSLGQLNANREPTRLYSVPVL